MTGKGHATLAARIASVQIRVRLAEGIALAERKGGTAISAKLELEKIHERSPIFHVAIATAGGGHVNVDVESGA